MGQYQQWLQYQEIRRHLYSQVEALEAELAQLQDSLDQLGQYEIASSTDNPIMQALVAHLPFQPVPPQTNAGYMLQASNSSGDYSGEPGNSISPALRSWGELPNFELYQIKETPLQDKQSSAFFNQSELELLPEDMIAFFDEHERTDPQLELPWWLRKITVSSKDEQAGRPIDHNSIRTNRLVQRWIERWGRQPSTKLRSVENTEEVSDE
ncbi:MAG TPA: hypothetical protein VE843_06295 [Ktedonobacteraceae bacterium]|nr:hypothetical protein [Ktedonobacteraceae bacterium]